MSRKLEAWLNAGLEANVEEYERQRKADENRALVAKEREHEAFEEFGKDLKGFIDSPEPDDNDAGGGK